MNVGRAKQPGAIVPCAMTALFTPSVSDPDAGPDIRAQTRASLAAIDANLEDGGSDKTRMLSVQIFLTDMSQKAEMDEVWDE